jgi:hypothetical protein
MKGRTCALPIAPQYQRAILRDTFTDKDNARTRPNSGVRAIHSRMTGLCDYGAGDNRKSNEPGLGDSAIFPERKRHLVSRRFNSAVQRIWHPNKTALDINQCL